MNNVESLRIQVEQLKMERKIERKRVSQTIDDLKK
jgi:hypothetical protein